MEIIFHDVINITDDEQTWVVCPCGESYRDDPTVALPLACGSCQKTLLVKAATGFWFSHEGESGLHGPFITFDEAKSRAIMWMMNARWTRMTG